MPRFKPYDYRPESDGAADSGRAIAHGHARIALHHLVEEHIEESWFDDLCANEEIGRPAYSPKLLLKVILLGYARGSARFAPVFANRRNNKPLDRFTYRGLAKVNVQWLLYCLVHNLEKSRPLQPEVRTKEA